MKFKIICPKCKANRPNLDINIETEGSGHYTMSYIEITCTECKFNERIDGIAGD